MEKNRLEAALTYRCAQSAVLQNGALIDTSVIGNATPGVTYGGVQVKVGGELEIRGSVDLENFTFTSTFVQSNVAEDVTGGRSGNVRLEANSILLKDFGQAQTGTSGAGDAGNVLITANQNLVVDGGGNISSTSSFGSGNAGNIELTSTHGNILVSGGFVSSQAVRSSGNSGSITVNAPEGDIILSGNEIFGPGVIFTETNRATGILGGIHVTAKNLQLLDGSNIEVVRFNNVTTLIPGSIDVTLSGNLNLDRGSFISTLARGPSPAADLNITAHDVNIAGAVFFPAKRLVQDQEEN